MEPAETAAYRPPQHWTQECFYDPFVFAIALLGLATPALAAECKATVESTDAMQFTTKSLSVPASCKQFALTLTHTGKLPRNVIGHNLVLGKTADTAGINADGIETSLDSHYVEPGTRG